MNTKLLSLSLALPILMIGADHSLAKKVTVTNQDTPKLTESTTARIYQVKLKTQQPQPFLISARDEEKKECQWLGICKER